MDAPNAKRRACIGRFGRPAPATAIAAQPRAAPPIPSEQATPTFAQTLFGLIFKSAPGRTCNFVLPIFTKATGGALRSFRNAQGAVPGPPFTFAYPSIEYNNDCRPAYVFGFMGYLEMSLAESAEAGTVGTILSSAPSVKIVGNNMYPEAEKATLVPEASELPMADNIGPAWGGLKMAKASLVVNTEAFLRTPKFERVVQMATAATMANTFGTNHISFNFITDMASLMGQDLA